MGRFTAIVWMFLLCALSTYPIPPLDFPETTFSERDVQESKKLLEKADNLYFARKFTEAIEIYGLVLENNTAIKAPVLKKIALSHAALNHFDECVDYLEQSLVSEFNPKILMDGRFDAVRDTEAFNRLTGKYVPTVDLWSFLYLYVALIGFYVSVLLNFNRKIDHIARTLISIFVFIHSTFIFHICISLTHYEYEFPHSYLMSTSFSFLYGPL